MSVIGSSRVLIVDDEDTLRSLLRLMLERSGRFEVVGEARDGREAIEMADSLGPDLILLDLSMPRMDGLEALPHLRRLIPTARVVVLSGFAIDSAARAAEQAGAHSYLMKGMSAAALIEALDDAVKPSGDQAPDRPDGPRPQAKHAPGGP